MAKISSEIKKQIDIYYKEEIKKLKDNFNIKQSEHSKALDKEFDEDINVKAVRDLFKDIKLKYGEEILNLSCHLYSYGDKNFYKTDIAKQIKEDIEKLEIEKRNLLITLETNRANSKEYQNALGTFLKKIEYKGV